MCLHVCALARVVGHLLLGIALPLALVWATMTALLDVPSFPVRPLKHVGIFNKISGKVCEFLTTHKFQFLGGEHKYKSGIARFCMIGGPCLLRLSVVSRYMHECVVAYVLW